LMEVNVKSINLIFFNNLELEVGKWSVKHKVSPSLTFLLGSFPLTPLDMVKGGSHMLSLNFYSPYFLVILIDFH
jgi:hypothetical protein